MIYLNLGFIAMNDCIAERRLAFSKKGSGVKKELVVRIGKPYIEDDGTARCSCEWDGLFENYADVAGIDSLHALQLAADIDSMLRKLRDKYDFYWSSGEPYFEE